ncbi:hypothetical protein EVAR_89928_1 [Eumeta japonica]|uniref:Uncharacterized protein n=1 Tax=Eumeta variegata TaxID=151549 RepID=A0A4C1XRP9_EUMVA|nr:hypothetical protein EVAR_89928_1 [Eumeta japonica]
MLPKAECGINTQSQYFHIRHRYDGLPLEPHSWRTLQCPLNRHCSRLLRRELWSISAASGCHAIQQCTTPSFNFGPRVVLDHS